MGCIVRAPTGGVTATYVEQRAPHLQLDCRGQVEGDRRRERAGTMTTPMRHAGLFISSTLTGACVFR